MFSHPSDKPVPLPTVTVHDRALILSLSQMDNQTIWRFDLDNLIESGFRMTAREGFYDLALTDLDGTEHSLARFLDKNEAHQTLAMIHDALTRTNSKDCKTCDSCETPSVLNRISCSKTRGVLRTLFGWLTFWRLLTLIAIALLLYVLLVPTVDMPPSHLSLQQPPANGVPLDADQLLQ